MDYAKRPNSERWNRRIGDSVENQRLEAERARLASAIDQASESIVITDPAGTIQFVNPAFERLTGYTRAEAIGQNPHILKSGAQDAAFYEAMWSILTRGETWRGTFVNRARDGRLFEEDATISPVFDPAGTLINFVAVKRDVTREREAERVLRQSELQFRTIFDSVGDGVAISGPGGKFLEVNRVVCERLGYTREQLLEMPISSINTAESAALIKKHIDRIMRDGVLAFETTHVRADGTEIPVEVVSRRIDFRGRPAILSVYRDIRERRRSEEAAREQSRLMQELLDALPIPIIAKGLDGRLQLANAAFAASPGRPRDELIGRKYSELGQPDAALHEAHDLQAVEEKKPHAYEADQHFPDGIVRRMLLTKAPLRSADGEVTGTVTAGLDISDRYRAEQALSQSEDRFRTLFESSPVAIWEEDLSGVAAYLEDLRGLEIDDFDAYLRLHPDVVRSCAELVRVVDVNAAAVRLHGAASKDELMRCFTRTFIPESFEAFRREFVAVWSGETHVQVDAVLQTLNDEPRFVTVSWTVAPSHDTRYSRVIVALVDETDRRRLEAQLGQAQKMEAIGRLAGGVAHDFNNLLTAIGGYARILETDLANGTADPADAAEIRHAADRAAALTAKLLTFAGRHDAQPTTIDLAAAVGQILPMLRRIVPERIEIVTELAPGSPIKADPTELDQVIVNLVVNAADAIPAIGRIAISTSCVDHDAAFVSANLNSRLGPHARLSVTDTGSGMDETVRARIFEPFFTTKACGEGTGLGLATVFGVVERMGGTIQLSSTPRRGTVFQIDLPASGSVAGYAVAATEPLAEAGVERILLVEDEATVRRFASTALFRLGYRVVSVGDPAAATQVPASDYDLLITDVVMPGMDGAELARRLRLKRRDLPVLFVSGYSHGTVSRDLLGAPRTAMLSKPYTAAELANAARRLIDESARH